MADSQDPQQNETTGQSATGGQNQGAAAGQNLGGIMEENVDISSLIANAGNQQAQQDFVTNVKIPPHPNTTFDEKLFIQLLAGSISLTVNEKKNIITAIPQLSQFQIDELIKIFKEEQEKFQELEKKHADQIAQLEAQHKDGWQDVESKAQEDAKRAEEAKQAEDLKKQLGL